MVVGVRRDSVVEAHFAVEIRRPTRTFLVAPGRRGLVVRHCLDYGTAERYELVLEQRDDQC